MTVEFWYRNDLDNEKQNKGQIYKTELDLHSAFQKVSFTVLHTVLKVHFLSENYILTKLRISKRGQNIRNCPV